MVMGAVVPIMAMLLATPHYFRMARVIGTGGAARAIVSGLAREGFTLVVAGRDRAKADALLTGDKDLLALAGAVAVPILAPADTAGIACDLIDGNEHVLRTLKDQGAADLSYSLPDRCRNTLHATLEAVLLRSPYRLSLPALPVWA